MVALKPITPQNAPIFRSARLRALQDTPRAFGSTYAKESQLTDADWAERAGRWNGETSVLYLAMDVGVAVGIAGSYLDHDDATRAHLISMWTASTHRQQGIGRLLVNEIVDCMPAQRPHLAVDGDQQQRTRHPVLPALRIRSPAAPNPIPTIPL
jgi:GNAT superfamily N-acetyltransferase